MNESRFFADGYQRSFARVTELMNFLKERGHLSSWVRKPAKNLRLITLEKGEEMLEDQADQDWREIIKDTKRNTERMLKMSDQIYPIRSCAIKTLVEHPFGTVKRAFGFSCFLTRGTESVRVESLLHFLVYNMTIYLEEMI